jgi:hypothetical protein
MPERENERREHQIDQDHLNDDRQSEQPDQQSGLPPGACLLFEEVHATLELLTARHAAPPPNCAGCMRTLTAVAMRMTNGKADFQNETKNGFCGAGMYPAENLLSFKLKPP